MIGQFAEFVVNGVGVVMISQMFLNERLDNLAKLFDGVKFIGESKFDFDVTSVAFAFVTVSGFEKIFRVIFRPYSRWDAAEIRDRFSRIRCKILLAVHCAKFLRSSEKSK